MYEMWEPVGYTRLVWRHIQPGNPLLVLFFPEKHLQGVKNDCIHVLYELLLNGGMKNN